MCFECRRPSRRGFLSVAGGAAVAAGLWAAGASVSPGHAATSATSLTPDEAIQRLKLGNQRFVAAPQLCEVELFANRGAVAKGQAPWATILTCADSRVPPELIFGGVGLGELFVARNAGNIVDVDVLGTIEYGIEHLGSPLVVVMGHNRCGAVQAACDVVAKHAVLHGSIKTMVDQIVPAAVAEFGRPGDFTDNVVRENARRSAAQIASSSEIVQEFSHAGKVKVVHARYDLDTGEVAFLG